MAFLLCEWEMDLASKAYSKLWDDNACRLTVDIALEKKRTGDFSSTSFATAAAVISSVMVKVEKELSIIKQCKALMLQVCKDLFVSVCMEDELICCVGYCQSSPWLGLYAERYVYRSYVGFSDYRKVSSEAVVVYKHTLGDQNPEVEARNFSTEGRSDTDWN